MSDGHFNKCFLPHNQFQSGLRAGKAQQRMKSIEAFRRFLTQFLPELDKETIEAYIASFKEELDKDAAPNQLERTKS